MYNNVPDDWNNFWTRCNECGHKWHLSEGPCCEKCAEIREAWLEDHCMNCEKEFTDKDYIFNIQINGESGSVCADCQSELHH